MIEPDAPSAHCDEALGAAHDSAPAPSVVKTEPLVPAVAGSLNARFLPSDAGTEIVFANVFDALKTEIVLALTDVPLTSEPVTVPADTLPLVTIEVVPPIVPEVIDEPVTVPAPEPTAITVDPS